MERLSRDCSSQSGTQNESVVLGQRKRIGGELVQCRIAQLQRRLDLAPLLLLTEDVGDVIGAESACRVCFRDRRGNSFRTIFAD